MALISNPISNTSDKNSFTSRWGLTIYEYEISTGSTSSMPTADLQDLAVLIGKHRAVAVEGEVAPQATRIRDRNALLEEYGKCLADLTNFQAGFKSDDGGYYDGHGWMPKSVRFTLARLGYTCIHDPDWEDKDDDSDSYDDDNTYEFYYADENGGCSANKRFIEGAIQHVKSTIDGLNNEAQLDMQRLQQLTDRRDEAYSATTNLMTSVSDTRSNLIRNF